MLVHYSPLWWAVLYCTEACAMVEEQEKKKHNRKRVYFWLHFWCYSSVDVWYSACNMWVTAEKWSILFHSKIVTEHLNKSTANISLFPDDSLKQITRTTRFSPWGINSIIKNMIILNWQRLLSVFSHTVHTVNTLQTIRECLSAGKRHQAFRNASGAQRERSGQWHSWCFDKKQWSLQTALLPYSPRLAFSVNISYPHHSRQNCAEGAGDSHALLPSQPLSV